MNPSDLKARLDRQMNELVTFATRDVPDIVGIEATNYFKESFEKEGFDNKKWQEVQRRIPGSPWYGRSSQSGKFSQKRATNPILKGETDELKNAAYKIGLPKLYTSFMVAYVPDGVAAGIGFGSILPIGGKFFFNPEINSLTTVNKYPQQYVSLLPRFGVKLNNRLSIVVAPTGTFTHTAKEHNLKSPLFQFCSHDVNDYQQFFWGGYAGVIMQL
jgi:hypothetical protein